MDEKRPVVITGNWKMHKTVKETVEYIRLLVPLVSESSAKILLAVPYTCLAFAAQAAEGTNIQIGAQNLCEREEGALTGEISALMLKEAGAQFVLIGHSERRQFFHETDQIVNKKIKRALKEGLIPTLCIGESAAEREAGRAQAILAHQLAQGLEGLSEAHVLKVMIAYEPVWAIGSSQAATPEVAEEMQLFCRQNLAQKWGYQIADRLVIQYGGSVKSENAKSLLEQPDIDGLLIGNASLSVESFSKIVNSSQNAKIRI